MTDRFDKHPDGSPVQALRRVLLIEDDPGDAELIAHHLDRAVADPIELVHTSGLNQALGEVGSGDFDAALLDLGLPDSSGVDTVVRLHGDAPLLPIVVLTGHADGPLAQRAIRAGAQDYISKHELDGLRLLRALSHAVARSRLQQQMRAVVERVTEGIAVCSPGGVIRFVNAAAEIMFGRSAAELVGERFPQPIDGPGPTEARLEGPGGEVRWVELRATELDWEGEPARLVSLVDFTDRKLGEELRTRLERAERLAAVGQLAAGVGHEINNPITYVSANVEALGEEFDHLRGAVARLRRCEIRDGDERLEIEGLIPAESMSEIAELLESSQVGLGRIAATVARLNQFRAATDGERIDLGEVLTAACRRHRSAIGRRARLELDLREVPAVEGDRQRLTDAVAGLIANAVEAIEPGDPGGNVVRVGLRLEGSEILIEVADTGRGIERSEYDRIFEPFYSTRSRGVGGGLGLTLAAETVRRHGGTVEVKSTPGAGTRFTIRLPAEPESNPRPADPEPATRRRLRILVVDDEPILLKALSRMLGHRHQVTTAAGGDEGIEALQRAAGDFDAVLCDMMMPETDGQAFHREVAERWPELARRIVFATGGAYTPEAKAFLESISNLQIKKPARLDRLLEVLEDAARR